MTTNGFEHVGRIASESAQAQVIAGTLRIVRRAWLHSQVHSLLIRSRRHASQKSAAERWRLAATVIAVAAFTNVIARAFMPIYAAPRLPVAVIVLIGMVAGAVVAAPEAFVRAWQESRFRRSQQR